MGEFLMCNMHVTNKSAYEMHATPVEVQSKFAVGLVVSNANFALTAAALSCITVNNVVDLSNEKIRSRVHMTCSIL